MSETDNAADDPQVPHLPAYPCDDGAQVRVRCPYCGRDHYHGAAVLGHRLAHCGAGAGYVLTDPKKLAPGRKRTCPDVQGLMRVRACARKDFGVRSRVMTLIKPRRYE